MFDAVADGRIKALWVMGTNPAVSLPRADAVRDGAGQARAAGRVGERRRQRHRCASRMCACRPRPGARRTARSPTPSGASRASARSCRCRRGARPDWWILSEVARRLGYGEAFAYRSRGRDLRRARAPLRLRERRRARLRHLRRRRPRAEQAFDAPRAVPVAAPRRTMRATIAPVRRRRLLHRGPQGALRRHRAAAPRRRRLRRLAVRAQHRPRARPVAHHDAHGPVAAPLRPISPSRSSRSIPTTPARLGLEQGTLARVATVHGAAMLRVLVNRGQQPGTLFVPMHWSAENSSRGPHRRARAAGDRSVLRPARGQGDAGAHRAAAPFRTSASLLSRQPLQAGRLGLLGARARTPSGTCSTSRSMRRPRAGSAWLRGDPARGRAADLRTMPAAGIYRVARAAGRPARGACCSSGPSPKLPSPEWLKSQFDRPVIPAGERRALLAGGPLEGAADEGPIVCVCFQVGAARIEAAAAAGDRTRARRSARAARRRHQLRHLHSRDPAPDCAQGGCP